MGAGGGHAQTPRSRMSRGANDATRPRDGGALANDDRVLTRLSFGTAHRQRSNCHDLSHVGQTLEPGVPALPRTDISRRRRAVACVSRGNLAYREPLMLASCHGMMSNTDEPIVLLRAVNGRRAVLVNSLRGVAWHRPRRSIRSCRYPAGYGISYRPGYGRTGDPRAQGRSRRGTVDDLQEARDAGQEYRSFTRPPRRAWAECRATAWALSRVRGSA